MSDIRNLKRELASVNAALFPSHAHYALESALTCIEQLEAKIATLEASVAANQKDAEQPVLTLALPDYDQRRLVIASDDLIDGERIVCVAINNNGSMYAPTGYVLVPDADNMTDEQAEAIAKVANCCGGIAEAIYRAIVSPRRRRPVAKALDTSTQEVG